VSPNVAEAPTLDRLDRQLIHALLIDGRAAFSRLGEVLGASEQTIARRYRRLSESGVVRVTASAAVAPTTDTMWIVRLGVRPGFADAVATGLAKRDDTEWVRIVSAGTEVAAAVRPVHDADLGLDALPEAKRVGTVTAHAVLRPLTAGRGASAVALADPLTDDQRAAIAVGVATEGGRARLERSDDPLLDVLRADGRARYAQLAEAAGGSVSRSARRVAALRAAGVLQIDVALAHEALGLGAGAMLWMSAGPSVVEAASRRVADAPETSEAAVVSGPANVMATITGATPEALHAMVVRELGDLGAVSQAELVPVARRVKEGGRRLRRPKSAKSV
jgi:DNA-binding Lrp family transcriptional regulator